MPKLRLGCMDDILVALDRKDNKTNNNVKVELHDVIGTEDAWKQLDADDVRTLLRAMFRYKLSYPHGFQFNSSQNLKSYSFLSSSEEERASRLFADK